eukprot:c554_g1_i1.p1 GENE.c554_g1_i1~~c554_g1_i1.p1  ORF type:complete len:165 (+),score=84.88 c554_g1_i1:50-496(+)
MNEAREESKPPPITDEEFEQVLDKIGVAEAQRPVMRAFDNEKKSKLKTQSMMDLKGNDESKHKARPSFSSSSSSIDKRHEKKGIFSHITQFLSKGKGNQSDKSLGGGRMSDASISYDPHRNKNSNERYTQSLAAPSPNQEALLEDSTN